jgi:predicted dehydrogenase
MRLGFVSAAHIHTRPYLEGILRAQDGRSVHAIWDNVPDRGRRHADLAQTRFEPDLEALLRDSAVDAFVVCAENTRHLPLLKRVVAAGRPVFCEKPLVTTMSDAREVAALLRSARAPVVTGYFLPFTSEHQAVAELLAQNAFGRITHFRIRNSHGGAYAKIFDSPDLRWFTEPTLAGGGAFMDVGAHAVHLARVLFGRATEARAVIRNASGIYPGCDDTGVAHLKFANGVIGMIEASWIETGGENGLEVSGAEQSLWKSGGHYVVGHHGRIEPKPLTSSVPRPLQIDRLVAAARGELSSVEIAADLAASLDAVAIMEACYTSARSGEWEEVAVI